MHPRARLREPRQAGSSRARPPPLPGTLSDKQKWNREIYSPSAAPNVWGGRARVAFGLTLGVVSMLYRYYGSYETGVCFAMILVGSFASAFDRLHLRWLDRKEALNQ